MFRLNQGDDPRLQRLKFGDYSLTRYKKPVDASLKLYRSVVYKGDRIVAFSPPQCMPLEEFMQKHPFEEVTVESFIDGVMINAFYDGEWKFATKSNVGATNKFYDTPFIQMLLNIELPLMDQNLCYSFVLQHEACRNVTPIEKNGLGLITSYRIDGLNIEETRHMPPLFANSYDEVVQCATSMSWKHKGLMLICGNDRAKIMSPAFVRVSKVKGNDSQFGFRYLQLVQQKILPEYLEHFPERNAEAEAMCRVVDSFTESLFRQYRQRKISYPYRPHVSALKQYQKVYLSPLPLTRVDVASYVATLPPAKLMYALNNINH